MGHKMREALNGHSLLDEKQELLFRQLRGVGSLVVAYSGGADSAYLAWAAHRMLNPRSLAVTALSPSFSAHDRQQASAFAHDTSLRHEFIETHEFENPLYVANNPNRCYYCKSELFAHLVRLAAARGFAAVAYAANVDDQRDFRPGHRAAAEHGILAPLVEAGLTKTEIRELSRRARLPTWDRPASACLSSRVPYGLSVTPGNLGRIELAETGLRELGFRQFRVRSHDDLARVEIAPNELPRALTLEVTRAIAERVKQAGFTYVCLDLEGYRQGSLNAVLKKE
jgi:uncharacterized protein